MPHELINKYKDGLLTEAELRGLHEAMKSSQYVRKEMMVSSIIDDFIKSDKAGIEMPEDFFDEVEDSIMMRYLSEVPEEDTEYVLGYENRRTGFARFATKAYRYAAAVAFIFLGLAYSISEFDFQRPLDEIALSAPSQTVMLDETSVIAQVQKPVQRIVSKQNSEIRNSEIGTSSLSSVTGAPESDFVVRTSTPGFDPVPVSDYANKDRDPVSKDFAGNRSNSGIYLLGSDSESPKGFLSVQSLPVLNASIDREIYSAIAGNYRSMASFGNDFYNSRKISFSTVGTYNAMATGLELNGSTPVLTIAQSVGFTDRESRHSAGFEFGYSRFGSYTYKKVQLPGSGIGNPVYSSGPSGHSVEGSGDDSNFIGGGSGDQNTGTLVKTEAEVSLIFGDLYYEYEFLRYSGTSLSGRIGIGLCGEELMGTVRLFGKQRLFHNLFLTAGIENRTFSLDIKGLHGNKYISMYNLTYGIQVVF